MLFKLLSQSAEPCVEFLPFDIPFFSHGSDHHMFHFSCFFFHLVTHTHTHTRACAHCMPTCRRMPNHTTSIFLFFLVLRAGRRTRPFLLSTVIKLCIFFKETFNCDSSRTQTCTQIYIYAATHHLYLTSHTTHTISLCASHAYLNDILLI